MIHPGNDQQRRVAIGRRAWVSLAVVGALFAVAPMLWRQVRGLQSSGPDLNMYSQPREMPNLRFADGHGAPTSLSAFLGKVVLLNVWATWCAPCRDEMPTLDGLQAMLGGPDFEVVALSIDDAGMPAVQAFLRRAGIQHLRPYLDSFGDASPRLGAGGIPLTLLIDQNGREIGNKLGPAAWDHPRVVQLIRGYLAPAATPMKK